MKAVVLAGGKGARLAPYTKILPRPLMPIGDMLSSFDVGVLPPVMVAAAALAMLAALGLSQPLFEHAPARVVPLMVGANAALLGLEWGLSFSLPRVAAMMVYLHTAAFGGTRE